MAGASAASSLSGSRSSTTNSKRRSTRSHDDVLFGYRLRLLTLAQEIGVRPARRAMGVHHSTYYRWKERSTAGAWRPCGSESVKRPRMPNQIGPHLEQRIPRLRPGAAGVRTLADLRRARRSKRGGIAPPSTGSGGCLGVLTSTLAPSAWRSSPATQTPTSEGLRSRRPSATSTPLSPARMRRWTAFSSVGFGLEGHRLRQQHCRRRRLGFHLAELWHPSDRNPRARWTAQLCHRVAAELKAAGWKLREVTTDNGSEFASKEFERPARHSALASGGSRPGA